jgi:hypothetical protein
MAFSPKRFEKLLAVIPETLRAGGIGVIPTHARRGSGTCPRSCGRSGHEADGGSSGDGSSSWRAIMCRPRPTHAAARVSGSHDSAAAHHSPARGTAARTDNRRSPHGASSAHRDVDHRTAFLELLNERATRYRNERPSWRSRYCEDDQTESCTRNSQRGTAAANKGQFHRLLPDRAIMSRRVAVILSYRRDTFDLVTIFAGQPQIDIQSKQKFSCCDVRFVPNFAGITCESPISDKTNSNFAHGGCWIAFGRCFERQGSRSDEPAHFSVQPRGRER